MPFACWRMCVCFCFGSWPHVCIVPMNTSKTCSSNYKGHQHVGKRSAWNLSLWISSILRQRFLRSDSWTYRTQYIFFDKYPVQLRTHVWTWFCGQTWVSVYIRAVSKSGNSGNLLQTRTNGQCTSWELSNVKNQSRSEFEIREETRSRQRSPLPHLALSISSAFSHSLFIKEAVQRSVE